MEDNTDIDSDVVISKTKEDGTDEKGFEGVEKILEIFFDGAERMGNGDEHAGRKAGLRGLSRSMWDDVLDEGKCSILVSDSNRFCDSYILSESSLFVYARKVIIKTCGRTTPLSCVPVLASYVKKHLPGMHVVRIGLHRKNYTFPNDQIGPHKSFKDEIVCVKATFSALQQLERVAEGKGEEGPVEEMHVLGDVNGEHWCTFTIGCSPSVMNRDDHRPTLNVIMYDLDEEVSKTFFETSGNTPHTIEKQLEIARLVDSKSDHLIHGYMFAPCGYSMNGLSGRDYCTIHITPESHCSYASFETDSSTRPFDELTHVILEKLRPKRFTVVYTGKKDPSVLSSLSYQRIAVATKTTDAKLEYARRRVDHADMLLGRVCRAVSYTKAGALNS